MCIGVLGANTLPNAEGYRYVFVNADGTARELHPSERKYLETEFLPGDGAAPHVKCSYDEPNGWGEIKGFLMRTSLPEGMPVHDAPEEEPSRSMNKAEYAEWLRGKGLKVTERTDGSLLISKGDR
jgi:hypothetical protein